MLAFLLLTLLLGCSGDKTPELIPAPVQPELESPDPELSSFLHEMFQRALDNLDSGGARGHLAMAYDVNGLKNAARLSYEQAHALDPADFRWPYFLSLLVATEGEHGLALDLLDKALTLDPGYFPAELWRGTYLLDLGRDEEAIVAFQRATELGGGPAATAGLARGLNRLNRAEEALALLEPVAEQFGHPFLFRLLGASYRALGRSDDTEIAMIRGRNAQPLSWPDERKKEQWEYIRGFMGLLNHSHQILASGQHEKALQLLESLRLREPDNETVLNNLSALYARIGRMDESISVLQHAIETHPQSFAHHLNIALRYESRNRVDLALKHLQRAVELSPDLSAAHEYMGEIHMRQGRLADAVDAFGRSHSPKGYYYLGIIAGSREDWPQAIATLERSVALDPGDARAYIYLARSLAEAGRYDEARAVLLKASRLGAAAEDFFNALSRLGVLERGS
jgi:tetratricopeptide (TPR) repeat protein